MAAVGHTHGGSLAKVVALQVTLTKLLLLETLDEDEPLPDPLELLAARESPSISTDW